MADSVFSVDGMLCLVHNASVLERRVEEIARQVGAASAVKEDKGARLVAVMGSRAV